MRFTQSALITNANQILDGTITGAKLANATITSAQIGVLDSLQTRILDIMNDAKTIAKMRLDYASGSDLSRVLIANNTNTLQELISAFNSGGTNSLNLGTQASLIDFKAKRATNIGAATSANDALTKGAGSIVNADINAAAAIAKSKLAVGTPQIATGSAVFAAASSERDVTAALTPNSYPALAIAVCSSSTFITNNPPLYNLTDAANVSLKTGAMSRYAGGTASQSAIMDGGATTIIYLVSSGAVKLRASYGSNATDTIVGSLAVVEF